MCYATGKRFLEFVRNHREKHLTPDDRLLILREADTERLWQSLDDQRVCVICNRVITGRQVQIEPKNSHSYSLRCPTDGCTGTPPEWLFDPHSNSSAAQVRKRVVDFPFFLGDNATGSDGITA